MQRARSPEAKERRREAILQASSRLLDEGGFDEVTMVRVARAAGIAKGTTYLYFRTKEELFLALLSDEYDSWFRTVRSALTETPHGSPPDRVAVALVEGLRGRKRFLMLMEKLHVVFEQDVAHEPALAFKAQLRDQILATARVLAHAAAITPDEAARLLLRMHALVVGLRQMTRPSPAAMRVIERDDMAPLRLEFMVELEAVLADLIRAAHVRASA